MGFAAFLDAISSPALKTIARHWQDARGARGAMPGWSDLRPSRIAAQLPIIWSYRYDPVSGEFTGRLAGDRISQIFGKNFRGMPMAQVHPPEAFPWAYGLCRRVVMEPALYRYAGRVFPQLDRLGLGERIMLPLASDGALGDGILGATEYHYPRAGPDPSDGRAGTESWFALEPP